MKFFFVLGAFVLSLNANGKQLDSDTKQVVVEIKSAVFELRAKCIGPQFEDDNFRTYFSDESYGEVADYLNSGYSWKLLDKSCGYKKSSNPQLSFNEYEKVQVLFVDGQSPRKVLQSTIEQVWKSRD